MNGTWQLQVEDTETEDDGVLNAWSLQLCIEPSAEGEGEGTAEGEGEATAEGEGEGTAEGEGEGTAEGEGEGTAEGEPGTILLPGDVALEMVWIPAGTFMMGRYEDEWDSEDSETPQHEVTFSSGFWMSKYEITKAQWEAVMGTKPWQGEEEVLDQADTPATHITWEDAQAFVTALNAFTGATYALPTEAQWEYACRAGTSTRFYWGDDLDLTALMDYAWCFYNTYDVGEYYAHAVGQKTANAFGLFDMSGNVHEWCEDDWHEDYTDAPADGSAWVDSPRASQRIVRGSNWFASTMTRSRSASRGKSPATATHSTYGMRLVLLDGPSVEGEGEGTTEGEGEGAVNPWHSADQNEDGRVSVSELLRVIQFFNSDGYQCSEAGEDGYAPGKDAAAQSCPAHDSDYNPQDWTVNLSELLRLIQFFNSGGYHWSADSEDDFSTGMSAG